MFRTIVSHSQIIYDYCLPFQCDKCASELFASPQGRFQTVWFLFQEILFTHHSFHFIGKHCPQIILQSRKFQLQIGHRFAVDRNCTFSFHYSRKCIEQYERIPTHLARLNTNAISSTAAILTRDRRLITSPRNPSTDDSKSLKSFSKRITSCL